MSGYNVCGLMLVYSFIVMCFMMELQDKIWQIGWWLFWSFLWFAFPFREVVQRAFRYIISLKQKKLHNSSNGR